MYSFCLVGESSFTSIRFCFCGKDLSSFFCTLLLSIYMVSDKKNIYSICRSL